MFARVNSLLRKHASQGAKGVVARLATRADYAEFRSWMGAAQVPLVPPGKTRTWLDSLERLGICVIPDYWSAKHCAAARSEVERVITQYPQYVNGNAKADVRVYGANNGSELIQQFAQDEALLSVASAYNHEPTCTAFTLAARLPASIGNKGSGEGWHRDAFLRQVKAILYLSDVEDSNGPFQWISESHRSAWLLRDMKSADLYYKQYRLSEAEADAIVASQPDRLKTFTATAGTLILVDTSSVHRGMPIREGTRYALTNYYFPEGKIEQSLYDKFDVLPPGAPPQTAT